MRLSTADQQHIRDAAQATLPPGSRVLLFGSRTDQTKRGGDIDLLVEPPKPLNADEVVQLRTLLGARLYKLMGERRIDIVVAAATEPQASNLLLKEARRHAIELALT